VSEVDVSGREVVDAFVVSLVVVEFNEGFDLSIQVCREEVVVQQDTVLEGLMPTFDLALGLRVIRCTTHMIHAFVIQPFSKITRDIAGTIVRQAAGAIQTIVKLMSRK